MRKSCRFAVVLVAWLGLAGAAQGAVLTSASVHVPVFGTFFWGGPPPITGTGSGSSVGLGATATLASNILIGTVRDGGPLMMPPITDRWVTLTAHAAGSFVAGGGPRGGLGGPMTLGGVAKLKAYSAMVTLVAVPVSPIGQPGGFALGSGVGTATTVQLSGTGWTTGSWTLMIPVTTYGNTSPWTLTATGADLRTASGAGTLVLISPMFLRTSMGGTAVSSFATLTLNYVPEPATLLLVGVGIAGLALRGRRRH